MIPLDRGEFGYDVLGQLQGQVAGLLRQGGQDPTLAHGIVVKALGESNDKYTQALARTGNMAFP
jgi:hypothetical protein